MPVDKEKIKGAIDDFENDDYISSKEKLRDEIRKVRDEFVKNKTNLEKDFSDNDDPDNDDPDNDDPDKD